MAAPMYLDDNGYDIPPNVGDFQAPAQSDLAPAGTDWAAIEQQLRTAGGNLYDPSDLEGVQRNTGYNEPGKAVSLEQALANQQRIYDQRRASNQPAGPQSGSYSFAGGGSGGPQSIQPYQPFAFDASQAGKSDVFKFRFGEAMRAIERSGAAKGTLLTPQVTQALQDRAVSLAGDDVEGEYARQAGVYDRNFGTHAFNETNRYSSQRSNRLDDYSFMDTDRRFARSNYESDRGFDYGKSRDDINDQWKFVDYGFNSARNSR